MIDYDKNENTTKSSNDSQPQTFVDVAQIVWETMVSSNKYKYKDYDHKIPILRNDKSPKSDTNVYGADSFTVDCSSYVTSVLYYAGLVEKMDGQPTTTNFINGDIIKNDSFLVFSTDDGSLDVSNGLLDFDFKPGDIVVRVDNNSGVHHINIISDIKTVENNEKIIYAYDAGSDKSISYKNVNGFPSSVESDFLKYPNVRTKIYRVNRDISDIIRVDELNAYYDYLSDDIENNIDNYQIDSKKEITGNEIKIDSFCLEEALKKLYSLSFKAKKAAKQINKMVIPNSLKDHEVFNSAKSNIKLSIGEGSNFEKDSFLDREYKELKKIKTIINEDNSKIGSTKFRNKNNIIEKYAYYDDFDDTYLSNSKSKEEKKL